MTKESAKNRQKAKEKKIQKKSRAKAKPLRLKGVAPKNGEGPAGAAAPKNGKKAGLQNGLKVF